MPKIVPVSDLRRRTSDVLNAVREDGEVYVTQYGRPIVVLLEVEQYESLLRQCTKDTSPAPSGSYTDHLAGLHREIWQDIDTDAYLKQERDAWQPSTTEYQDTSS
jgi:prevent-host-death family protein